MRTAILSIATVASAQCFDTNDSFRPLGPGCNYGTYFQDFSVAGPAPQAVHDSQDLPTGLAVDASLNIYLTYPRNSGQTLNNAVRCTKFISEEPWPTAEIQKCTEGQDPLTCFIDIQNVFLDPVGRMWVVDSDVFA